MRRPVTLECWDWWDLMDDKHHLQSWRSETDAFQISTLLSSSLSDLINAVGSAPNLSSYAHWCWLQTECTVISTRITGESNKQRMRGHSYAYVCKGTAVLTHTQHKSNARTQTHFRAVNKDYAFIRDTVGLDSSGLKTVVSSALWFDGFILYNILPYEI